MALRGMRSSWGLQDPRLGKQDRRAVCPRDCVVHQDDWMERQTSKDWVKEHVVQQAPPPFDSGERSRLKSEIETNEAEIASLLKRVEILKDENLKRQVRLSPVRLVPPEILSRIFFEVSKSEPEWFAMYTQSAPTPSIVLVSKEWRDIAESTPQLWSRIHVADIQPKKEEFWEKKFQARMDRIKGSHLDLDISLLQEPKAILAPVLKTYENWRSLSLTMTKHSDVIEFLGTSETFPKLTDLRLSAPDARTQFFWNPNQPAPVDAPNPKHPVRVPNLRILSLAGPTVRDLYQFRAPRLKTLNLRGFDISVANLKHLERFPNLRELTIVNSSVLSEVAPSCPKLKHVTIGMVQGIALNLDFLRNCTAIARVFIESSGSTFSNIGRASFPSVHYLEFRQGGKVEPGPASQVLALFPRLTTLVLTPLRTDSYAVDPRVGHQKTISAWLNALALPPYNGPPLSLDLTKIVLKKVKFGDEEILTVSCQRAPADVISDEDKAIRESDVRYKEWDPKLLITMHQCTGFISKVENAGPLELKRQIDARPPAPPSRQTQYGGWDALGGLNNLFGNLQQQIQAQIQNMGPQEELQAVPVGPLQEVQGGQAGQQQQQQGGQAQPGQGQGAQAAQPPQGNAPAPAVNAHNAPQVEVLVNLPWLQGAVVVPPGGGGPNVAPGGAGGGGQQAAAQAQGVAQAGGNAAPAAAGANAGQQQAQVQGQQQPQPPQQQQQGGQQQPAPAPGPAPHQHAHVGPLMPGNIQQLLPNGEWVPIPAGMFFHQLAGAVGLQQAGGAHQPQGAQQQAAGGLQAEQVNQPGVQQVPEANNANPDPNANADPHAVAVDVGEIMWEMDMAVPGELVMDVMDEGDLEMEDMGELADHHHHLLGHHDPFHPPPPDDEYWF